MPGDEIVLVASERTARERLLARPPGRRPLPGGYATTLPTGAAFGDALLDRTIIYAGLVRSLLAAELEIHYLSHITGHGLLKLMRPRRELSYTINRLPPVPPVLGSPRRGAEMSPATRTRRSTWVPASPSTALAERVRRWSDLARELSLSAQVAGTVGTGPAAWFWRRSASCSRAAIWI